MSDENVPRETSVRPEIGKSQEDDLHVVNSSAIQQQPPPQKPQPNETKDKKKPAIRHAEKRRTSTCRFADRVAKLSVDHYKATIPVEQRPPQTCIATILAHYRKPEDCCDNKDKDNDNDNNDLENSDDHEHDRNQIAGTLWILSMGVGTKFLSESCLRKEVENENEDHYGYGSRVRDMHAEVLARRAFRRQLTLEIQEDLKALEKEQTKDRSSLNDMDTLPFHRFGDRENTQERNLSILVRSKSSERHEERDSNIRYTLRPGVTLHMYTSSAPCGNATLKKFCKMSKERFRDDLGPDEWPDAPHEPPPGHSIKLGEFSLLVKRDNTNMAAAPPMEAPVNQDIELLNTKKRTRIQDEGSSSHKMQSLHGHKPPTRRGKPWPATLSDDWTPPGTTIVGFQHKGSIHTCSDKICRWNYLGLQGSLLSGILDEPLYLSTLTVGRKLSGAVCRRAICCRLDTRCEQPKLPKTSEKSSSTSTADSRSINENKYRVNHPAVMGTSVYLDTGIVDTSNVDERGQDVRFHSSLVWCWWSGLSEWANGTETCARSSNNGVLECIESSSGFLAKLSDDTRESHDDDTGHDCSIAPMVSTKELTSLFLQVHHRANPYDSNLCFSNTLSGVREIKKICSPMHETFKDLLLTEHKVLSHWRRREDRNKCINCTISTS